MAHLESQYLDLSSGMHVFTLRDGNVTQIHQISLRDDTCVACGHVSTRSTEAIDPKAEIAARLKDFEGMLADWKSYAKKHGIPIK